MAENPSQPNPQPSINTFMNIAKQDPLFQQLPVDEQERIDKLEIDNPVDLLKDLQSRSLIKLRHGKIEEVKTMLELAQKLARIINDKSKEMQIGAWINLIELHEKESLSIVIDAIKEEVRQTPEFQKFLDRVTKTDS